MNILLFHPQKDLLDMTRFCLESQMNLTVLSASNFQEAMDILLGENNVDLIITNHQAETDKLFKYLLSTSANVPVIMINTNHDDKMEAYPDIKIIGQVHASKVPQELIPLIDQNFHQILQSGEHQDYVRIQTNLLLRVVPLRGDIYIRLSSVKYVKLFKTGASFTQEDLEKYMVRKKVNFLYVKTEQANEFAHKLKDDIALLVANASPEDPQIQQTVMDVMDVVQELTQRLGFTEEVQTIAKSNVELAMKAIGNNPKLGKAISSSALASKNYISSHSMLLANIACSIAAQMQWPSDTTFHKLTLAALFHDFSFTDPNLARINLKSQIEQSKNKLSADQVKSIELHPSKASEFIKSMAEIPSDVDVIVTQHHERPDGTGFPKGLRANQIAPLAAVFIVAHDVIDELTSKGHEFNFSDFLKTHEELYQNATFKKVWKALAKNDKNEKLSQSKIAA